MTAHLRTAVLARLAAAALLLPVLAAGPASTAALPAGPAATEEDPSRQSASLSVSARDYYGGQGVVYSGTLGRPGTTPIWLEYHMGRPGDVWTRIDGSTHRTDARGDFSFRFPAPSMYNIRIRVASADGATNGVVFKAHDQALTLEIAPADGRWPQSLLGAILDFILYPAVDEEAFTITVDTAPEGGPVLVGRPVTLQRRIGAAWSDVATGRAGRDGLVSFRQVATEPGTVAYRAVAGDWTADGSRIGWFPSFPTLVDVVDERSTRRLAVTARASAPDDAAPTGTVEPASATPGATAGQRYQWGPSLFDFAFEWGESLTDPPARGTRRQGRWRDDSTGTGRVAKHNGGLFFESKFGTVAPRDAGPGDRGTTTATLSGNAQAYGRWELRFRTWELQEPGTSYRVKAQLVPENPAHRACGARAITIADVTPGQREVRFGVTSPARDRSWTGRKRGVTISQTPNAHAVEVTRRHITWFVNGVPVGTVRSRAAVPDVPLTLRLALVGRDDAEMKHTYSASDWIRAWPINRSRPVTNGPALRAGRHDLGC